MAEYSKVIKASRMPVPSMAKIKSSSCDTKSSQFRMTDSPIWMCVWNTATQRHPALGALGIRLNKSRVAVTVAYAREPSLVWLIVRVLCS